MKPSEKTNTYIGCARNINETKKKEEQLKLKAHIDPLSKVLNRETAIEKIRERLKAQKMNEECAFIVLDIDNFKNINDTFGHLYGDAVIAMVAGSIKSTLDSKDIIGRFGGDEFLVYIDNTKPEKLERKLENIRLAILKMRIDKKIFRAVWVLLWGVAELSMRTFSDKPTVLCIWQRRTEKIALNISTVNLLIKML